jgi:hypothetical protein
METDFSIDDTADKVGIKTDAASAVGAAITAAVAAIPDATPTVRGLVSTGAQSFAGDKTLTGLTTSAGLKDTTLLNAPYVKTDATGRQIAGALATDTVPGIVALNLGTNLPADSTNSVDALTATGLTAILSDAVNPVNPIQAAVRKLAGMSSTVHGFDFDNATTTPNAYSTNINAAGNGVVTATHLGMKRCLLKDDGTVNYYLSTSDSTKKVDGSDAVLTGADGQVMVEIPKYYVKQTKNGTVNLWEISDTPANGYMVHPAFIKDGVEVAFRYISAYEASVLDVSANVVIDGLNLDNNLARVDINTDKLASVSGKYPMVGLRRSDFRKLASNRGSGWRQQDFWLIQAIQILYLVEFGTFDSQTSLGFGNTTVSTGYPAGSSNQADSPHSISGKSNSLGNASTNATTGANAAARDTAFMSYRGIENFFGNCWKWVDGWNIQDNNAYVSNTSPFADDTATGYTYLTKLPSVDGWQATLQSLPAAILPSGVGASSTTGFTDHYWQAAGWRVAVFGGVANAGALSGAFCWDLNSVSGALSRAVGARVAY